jgi:glycosyltransferase involved in cell wall biosynthesis
VQLTGSCASSDPAPSPLRIAVVAPPWAELPPSGYGGIEAVCADLVSALLRHGHHLTLVGVGRNGTDAAFVRTYGLPQIERIGQALPEVVHAATLPSILAGLDLDVVHDHTLAGPLLARTHGLPTVVTAHGPVTGEMGTYYRSVSRWVRLVAISEAQRVAAPDVPWFGTVHNAVDPHAYPITLQKGDYALFLGRMSPDKGVPAAIRVARSVGVPLVVAAKCREPGERRYFDEVVAPLLGDDVEWVGEVGGANKLDLLGRARCLLFPIEWEEPFGMVMIEALACGTPVVALSRGSVPEIVRHGETGFVCVDHQELAEAVLAAPSLDPARCRREVETRFGADHMAACYELIYREAVRLAQPASQGRPPHLRAAEAPPASPVARIPKERAAVQAVHGGSADRRRTDAAARTTIFGSGPER